MDDDEQDGELEPDTPPCAQCASRAHERASSQPGIAYPPGEAGLFVGMTEAALEKAASERRVPQDRREDPLRQGRH